MTLRGYGDDLPQFMKSSSVGEQESVNDGMVPVAVVTLDVVAGVVVIGVIRDAVRSSAAFAKGRARNLRGQFREVFAGGYSPKCWVRRLVLGR